MAATQRKSRAASFADCILELQRCIGNRAVAKLLHTLHAGAREDRALEQEAEQTAQRVTTMRPPAQQPGDAPAIRPLAGPAKQRADEPQRRDASPAECSEEPAESLGEESLSPQPVRSRASRDKHASGAVTNSKPRPPLLAESRRLPDALRAYFEPRFGADLGDVRVHTGAVAARAAASIHAQAFTAGHDIFFGHNHYAPSSRAGRLLIAHELAHVIQHVAGRVVPRASVQRRADKDLPVVLPTIWPAYPAEDAVVDLRAALKAESGAQILAVLRRVPSAEEMRQVRRLYGASLFTDIWEEMSDDERAQAQPYLAGTLTIEESLSTRIGRFTDDEAGINRAVRAMRDEEVVALAHEVVAAGQGELGGGLDSIIEQMRDHLSAEELYESMRILAGRASLQWIREAAGRPAKSPACCACEPRSGASKKQAGGVAPTRPFSP